MAQAAIVALQVAQRALVEELQAEFFCDDLEPPAGALGWDFEAFKEFYESGGEKVSSPAKPAAAAARPDAAGPDAALNQFLEDAQLRHLSAAMAGLGWDDCAELYKDGRTKLLSRLGKLDIKLSDRQKFVRPTGAELAIS